MQIARKSFCFSLAARILALLALVLVAPGKFKTSVSIPQELAAPPLVSAVASVGMTVRDLDRSVEFYSHILSFSKIREMDLSGESWAHLEGVFGLRIRIAWLQLGNEQIALKEFVTPKGRSVPEVSFSNDRWFQHLAIITSDMDRAYGWLQANKVRYISSSPQLLPAYLQAAGIRAFYFEDPDGHPLEIFAIPGGQRGREMASEHVAAVFGSRPYGDRCQRHGGQPEILSRLLGFKGLRESENYGPEQEHLNSVFGARLRIMSMRAASGPGIELLEYLAPTNGRPMPEDEHANDLIHHETCLVTTNLELAARLLRQAPFRLISSAVVEFPEGDAGFHSALLVRDPHGHPMELVQE